MTAMAGIGLSAYAATGDPLIGAPFTLASISAAVLGGISFSVVKVNWKEQSPGR